MRRQPIRIRSAPFPVFPHKASLAKTPPRLNETLNRRFRPIHPTSHSPWTPPHVTPNRAAEPRWTPNAESAKPPPLVISPRWGFPR